MTEPIRRSTYDRFIAAAREQHGDKYEYGSYEEVDSEGRIRIICKTHGPSYQYRSNHLRMGGCRFCAYKSKTTTVSEFIARSRAKHGDKFDYSRVTQFGRTSEKVPIICPDHGEFLQQARDHMRGIGCQKCGFEAKEITYEEFLVRAREKHGDRYEYRFNPELWKGKDRFVEVICSIHGMFPQRQYNHTVGDGCMPCSNEAREIGPEEFWRRVESHHGDRYTYDRSEYKNTLTMLHIICPDHGEFVQIASSHAAGSNCPSCFNNQSKAERRISILVDSATEHEVLVSQRGLIGGKLELDIYVPELGFAVEYNGCYWHPKHEWAADIVGGSADSKESVKSLRAAERGIVLLHLWEDDYESDPEFWSAALVELLAMDSAEERAARVAELHRVAASSTDYARSVYGGDSENAKAGLARG